jgi:putative ABC transport system permease protein
MTVIWHKIWRDLANNRARTALVVASTAVGVFALGLVFGLSGIMGDRMTAAYRQAQPAHIAFDGGPFTRETIDAIEHERGVESAQGEIAVPLRWRFAHPGAVSANDAQDGWRDARLVARADYEDQSIDLLRLLEGRWPGDRLPRSHASTVAIDRLSADHFGVDLGTVVLVESGQRERPVSIQGVVHAYDVLSPAWGGTVTFYAARDTVGQLTGYPYGRDFNRLQVRLTSFDPHAPSGRTPTDVAERIEDRLERMGLTVDGYKIHDPGVHPMQDQLDAVLAVLGVMGGLSLGLSAFLIINVINAILARQIRQIGVMKAIGATLLHIVRLYLAVALIYGALAILLAVPLGVAGAHLVALWLLDMFNVPLDAFRFQPLAVAVQLAVGLAVPPLAALAPVLNAARITVREAVGGYGLGQRGGFGRGWLDRLVSRVRSLPRVVALGLRNAFRRKGRVALTLLMLTFSGAMFVIVMSTRAALQSTFHVIFELEGDLAVSLERPYEVSRLIESARDVPGVVRAEVWHQQIASLCCYGWPPDRYGRSPDQPSAVSSRRPGHRREGEEPALLLTGVPFDSAAFHPRVIDGRTLRPDDGRAILVNNRLVAEEGIRIGDVVTLRIAGQESRWVVVGSYLSLNVLQDVCYVPREALARETGTRGEGTVVQVLSEAQGVESQRRVVEDLIAVYEAQNIEVAGSYTTTGQWQESQSAFSVLIYLLLAMAGLVAVVGSIGLASAMSINVVERTREIGVMRAVGATARAIATVFVVEGVLIGCLSWLLAVPLSLPGAYALGAIVGQAIVQIPLDFAYSVGGVLLWLLIVVILSALASLWPALRATRVSVHQSLAYE